MLIQSTFITLLAVSVILAMALAFFAWLKREIGGAASFMIMMAGSVVWGVSYIFEILSSSLEVKLLWDTIQFAGLDLVGVGMFLFVLVYTGRAAKYKRFWWILLLEPAISVGLIWADPWLHWLRLGVKVNSTGLFTVLDYQYGPAMWGLVGYTYFLVLISLTMLIIQYFRHHRIYRLQIAILIAGISFPIIGSVLTILGWIPVQSMPNLDITPITLAIANVFWAIGLFYFHLLDIMPIVRQIAFDEMADALFVLDVNWRIVDLNIAAQKMIDGLSDAVVGCPVINYLPQLGPYLNEESVGKVGNEITLTLDGMRFCFSAKLSALYDHRSVIGGWLLVLMDITKMKNAEEQIRHAREVSETLREAGTLLSSTLDFDQLLGRMLELIERVIPYDSANIMLVENNLASTKRTRGYEKYGPKVPKTISLVRLNIDETKNLKWMVCNEKPLVIDDVWSEPDWIDDGAGSSFRSWMGAPIISHKKVSAFFSLGKMEPGFYTQDNAEQLVVFAAQAALAMENARLYTEIRIDLKREQRINESMRIVNRLMDVEDILQNVIQLCLELFHAERAELGLIESNGGIRCDEFTLLADGRLVKWEKAQDSKNNLPQLLVETNNPVLITITDEDPPYPIDLSENNASSLIGLPLMAGDHRIGILCIMTGQEGKQFTRHDLTLAESIGQQAGNAIQNARLFEDVQRLATTDSMTGWYNRRYFFELAQKEIERSMRYGHSLSMIMLDIDRFKIVNDTHGHLIGDQVLRTIAKRLKDSLRQVDFGGRYGGEEFIILLPETGIAAAQQAAERLRETISQRPIATTAGLIPVTISLGVASIAPGYDFEIEKILNMVDQALYAAKKAGRNKAAVWWESGIHTILPLPMNQF